ncbi:MAG TPA: formate dehydrogenase subunit gamma [Burkholderiales bacterium]|nr:formate dehydrogenase subunit gamma [Burkholderiales bacterium]
MFKWFSVLPGAALLALLLAPMGALGAEDPASQQAERQQAQPLNNAPVWREVRSGNQAVTQVRGRETGVLVQPGGETWRQLRNGPITIYGGILLLAVVAAIGVFFKLKGPIKVHGKLTGRKILRLTEWDRAIHWTVAICWVILGISGLVILFGKYVLLPVFGYTLFSWLAIVSKNLHNFTGPLFLISAVAMLVTYFTRNIPRLYDLHWLAKGGGMLTGEHVPSGFFNAGEKMVYWGGLFLFSVIVGASGLVMLFPNFDQTREIMQYSNVIHAVFGVLYVAMMCGHIYLGSVGLEGAYECMRTDGLVDEQWAKEHHEYWYQEVMARGESQPRPAAGAAAQPQH